MQEAFICDAIRTPIGRYGGGLSSIRPDDLAAMPIKALIDRNQGIDIEAIDDVILGCANQAGEDNRNLARFAALLAGLPKQVPGVTVNRLCGSGMDAVMMAARAIIANEADLIIAGGAESMSRAPFVVGKSTSAFSREANMFDTTIGWRFVNPVFEAQYGIDSMPHTAENVADDFQVSRDDQDEFALRSQQRAATAIETGRFAREIGAVTIPQRKKDDIVFATDEHPRASTRESLARLRPFVRSDGTITAGNASGVNDGAAAIIVASAMAVERFGLTPRARYVAGAVVGVDPRIMGIGPAPAAKAVLERAKKSMSDMNVIEINEAFASQSLATLRKLGLADDSEFVNPNGGAIALGHPLGMSGARLVQTAIEELHIRDQKFALCAMCIGVGQGIASIFEKIS